MTKRDDDDTRTFHVFFSLIDYERVALMLFLLPRLVKSGVNDDAYLYRTRVS